MLPTKTDHQGLLFMQLKWLREVKKWYMLEAVCAEALKQIDIAASLLRLDRSAEL